MGNGPRWITMVTLALMAIIVVFMLAFVLTAEHLSR